MIMDVSKFRSIDVSFDEKTNTYKLRIKDPLYKGEHPVVFCSDFSLADVIIKYFRYSLK